MILARMRNFVVLVTALLLLSAPAYGDTRTNGNVAFTLTKEYFESHQDVFQRYFIKETEEMTLKDVRVQTKVNKGRMTSLMSSV